MLKRYELQQMAETVHDVRSQIEVARIVIEDVHELAELVKSGLTVTLEHLQEELEEVEFKLTPPPVSARDVVPMFEGSNVVGLRLVA